MAFENMQEKQSWHHRGAKVDKDGKMGVITQFSESKMDGKVYVHTLWVRLEGCIKPWPFNPNDIRSGQ